MTQTTTGRTEAEVVAGGGPDDILTTRRLSLRGSQTDIGRALATEARTRFGWAPYPAADPLRNRARRRWFAREWPAHHARMLGVAEALGLDPERDDIDFSAIASGAVDFGCSAVWYPPQTASDGHGRIVRNFDFFTGGWQDMIAVIDGGRPADVPAGPRICETPYVIDLMPDEGPASTAISIFGFDGATDGVNEHGLAVVLLMADVETARADGGALPTVGLNPTQVPRFLLDTCADVDEAKEALLSTKQYDESAPCHYLIADAAGRGFVWERSPGGDEHIIEVDDGPLCVTNHLLHRHPDVENLPADNADSHETYERMRTLTRKTRQDRQSVSSPEMMRADLDGVAPREDPSWRTIWRTVTDVQDRSMSAGFYLGESQAGDIRNSEEVLLTVGRR
ncbi:MULTISPECIES: C45 family peptidase [Actinoalloteichus]|uniref:Acyl-coenzyme A:6-aminopenicillanic acid acyl-transferase n=1 Tax=Actinoalloteichus fjordicus TaxID=1612552 RepID=A0AAC9LGA8_9PSEU|nr:MULTISPECIES: C45 family peptidase [Actinoalloteichus]APU15734.1 Acyl-coenzyme A:6-aminopenicillanic acid acyl-transferase [Actinoalloteichus fjordicus]APU21794.1 Acyl-coenzyme A:6-aminopenicillanic acid acyl-transferase [Actinoalloteichus sp. GBA129-24]